MADYYWKGLSGGTGTHSNVAANWMTTSGGSTAHTNAPGVGDNLFFDITATKICVFTGSNAIFNNLTVKSTFPNDLSIIVDSYTITLTGIATFEKYGVLKSDGGGMLGFVGVNSAGTNSTIYDNAPFLIFGSQEPTLSGIFHSEFDRQNFTVAVDLLHMDNQDMILLDGIYPNVSFLNSQPTTAPGKTFKPSADPSAYGNIQYSEVDMLNFSCAIPIKPGGTTAGTPAFDDYNKTYRIRGTLTLTDPTFFWGNTTLRLTPTAAGQFLPANGESTTYGGTGPTFAAKYNRIIIDANTDFPNYYFTIRAGLKLFCNKLEIRSNARLYGSVQAVGTHTSGAEIHCVSSPVVHGDWNFSQISRGVYRNTGTIPLLSHLYGGTGLSSVGTAGQVLAVNNDADGLLWSSTAGGGGVTVENAGSALNTTATTLDFTGNGVTASGSGAEKTITITDTNTVYTHPNHSGDVTSSGDGATTIAADAVTYAKMQNVSATNRILGRDSTGAGVVEEISPSSLRTMINVADGANNYSHPTGAGNKHIPSGGASGNFLKYDSSGTAVWATPSYITNTDVNVSKANLLTVLAGLDENDTLNIGDAGDDTNVVIRGNLQVDGTTTTVNSTVVNIDDSIIKLHAGHSGAVIDQDAGIEIERGDGDNKLFFWDEGNDRWTVGSETMVAGTFVGALTGNVTGNLSGLVTTAHQSVITRLADKVGIGGAAHGTAELYLQKNNTSTFPLLKIGNAGSGDAGMFFEAGGTVWSIGVDNSDSDKLKISQDNSNANLHTNTRVSLTTAGVMSVPAGIVADVTGDVTGDVSGTAATVTGAAQTNITSLGTLTSLTVAGTGTANSPTLAIDNSSSETFNHAIEAFHANLTANETAGIFLGKAGSTKNSGYLSYKWKANGDNSNIIGLSHWGNDWLLNVTGDGKVGIGTESPGHKLHVTSPPDDSGDYAIYADEGSDNYAALVNRHSGNRRTALFYRNIHADYTAKPMVEIHQDHASDDQAALYIQQDGSGPALSVADTSTLGIILAGTATSDGVIADISFRNAADSIGAIQMHRVSNNSQGDMTFHTQPNGGNVTERMRIDSTGKVGIGATPGSYKLVVEETTNPQLRLQNPTNAANGWDFRVGDTGSLIFKDDGTERVRFAADGKVGIGESSPSFPLHLKYTDTRTDPQGKGSATGAGAIGGNAEGGGLYVENDSLANGVWSGISLRAGTADARIAYKYLGGPNSGDNEGYNEGQMSFYLDVNDGDVYTLQEVLRLRGGSTHANAATDYNLAYVNGRMGIGTTNPEDLLHISKGNLIFDQLGNQTSGNFTNHSKILFRDEADATTRTMASIGAPKTAWSGSHHALTFNTGSLAETSRGEDYDYSIERMRIDSTGKVGIGTTTPLGNLVIANTGEINVSLLFRTEDGNGGTSDYSSYGIVSGWESGETNWTQSYLKFNHVTANNTYVNTMTMKGPKVGIGTTSPSYPLQLDASVDTGLISRFYNTSTTNGQGLLIRAGETGTAARVLQVASRDDTKIMTVNSDGKVGIGITAPDTIFHISSAAHPSIRITGTDNANADPAIEMLGQGNSFAEGMQMWYDNGTGVAHIASLYDNTNADIQFHTRVAADRSTSNVRMVIEGDGNVGIGTTTPSALLHLKGASGEGMPLRVHRPHAGGANYGVGIEFVMGETGDASAERVYGELSMAMDGVNGNAAGGSAHDGYFAIRPSLNGTPTERMRVLSNGNVGIGDTTPDEKLQVAGNIRVNNNGAIKADGTGYLTLGNTNNGLINVGGTGSVSYIEATSNHLVLQTQRDSDDIIFSVNKGGTESDGTAVEALRIHGPDGRIGINQSSPEAELHVEGSIAVAYALAHAGQTSQNRLIFGTNTQTYQTAGTDRLTIAADGAVTVAGAFAAATKEFVIEHPTKPNMKLHHGSLEGPEHAVYVRGQHNASVITLPDYWEGLVDEDTITVQLTPIGEHQELFVKQIKNGKVRVASKKRNQMLKYFYFIQGERKDVEKLEVEECLE